MQFRGFVIVSGALAAVSLIGPWTAWYIDFDLAAQMLRIGIWCALATVPLFIAGLFLFRLRGLWLAVPMVIAFALPAYVVIAAGNALDDCLKHQATTHLTCVP
jgi:hypothetical protein